jgi:predicted glycosyltransferase
MKIKKLLRFLGAADRVLGKLGKLTFKACLIAKILYDLYQIVAHH